MVIGVGLALFLSAFIALLMAENYGYGYWMISRPIFGGPLLGLIMGDLQTGLIVGASVELMFMGVLPIGGSVPPNAQIAGLIGTFFAISSGGNPEVGIALALPIGTLAQFLIMLAWNFNIILIHRADRAIKDLNTRKMELTHLSGLLVFFIVMFIPTFLAIYFGSGFVNNIVEAMPDWVMNGLEAAAGILPAVGMAMLLRMMDFRKYWSFFLIGFVFAVYLELDVLSVALLAFGIVMSISVISKNNNSNQMEETGFESGESDEIETILTKKDLKRTFLRSFFSMTSINYERYTSLGFCYAILPSLKKLYKNEDELREALNRHNEFFNCHPYTSNVVLGVSLALEEQRSQGKPITQETIVSTKAALMGPLSGIGDSVFKATFMTVFAAIGAGLALDGNILGPIVFIVPNVLLNVFSRYYFVTYGYKFGVNLIKKMKESDVLSKFVQGATIVGLMVIGAMIFNFVNINMDGEWNFGGKDIVLQELLDSILPGLLPLTVTLLFLLALIKNKKAIYWLILSCFAIGLVGSFFGIL